MELWNPLKVLLQISELQLVFKFHPEGAPAAAAAEAMTQADMARAVSVGAVAHELMPQALTKVTLRLIPHAEGDLKITGVRWLLLGKIQCAHDFQLQGVRLNKTKQQRKSAPVYAKDLRLSLKVCRAMPLLRVETLPIGADCSQRSDVSRHAIRAGELRRITMRLSNVGRTANMESVTVAVSDPAFCFFDDGDITTTDASNTPPRPVAPGTVLTASSAAAADLTQNQTMATLISGEAKGSRHRLAPTESAEFSLWVYGAARAGQHAIGLLFYYDADPAHPATNYRLFQHTVVIDIQPSVDVAVIVTVSDPTVSRPFPGQDSGGHQLTVEVANNGPVAMELQQLGCLSSAFRVVRDSVKDAAAGGGGRLEPGQKQWLQLRLARVATEPAVEESAPLQLFHTTVELSGGAAGGAGDASALMLDRVVWAVVCRQSPATVGWLRSLTAHGEVELSAKQFLLGVLARPCSDDQRPPGDSVASGSNVPLTVGSIRAQAVNHPTIPSAFVNC